MTGYDLAAPLTRLCRREFLKCRRKTHPFGSSRRMAPATIGQRLRHISSRPLQLHVEFARSSEILVEIRQQEISYIALRKIAISTSAHTSAFFVVQR